MSIVYKPKGKAGEYADLAANLYTGCSHGCLYCYAPRMLHRDRETFHAKVEPRASILDKLKKEAHMHRGKEVFLCFTCDPYCDEDSAHRLTRKAITILHDNGVAVNILTKGGIRAMRDFDLLRANPHLSRIGTTLTFANSHDTLAWEPRASHPIERVQMLREAKANGIATWASLEPVIDPEQTLSLIRQTASFVDHYKVGRWNYDARANDIDWADFLQRTIELFKECGASYYIKKDLACFSDSGLE